MKEIAKILYGSQNFQLDGPTSDCDYKVIYTPSFEDLFYRREADQHSLKGYDKDHYAPIDVRKFGKLALAGNINIVEMLFSIDIQTSSPEFEAFLNKVKWMYNYGYILNVWSTFSSSLEGLIMNSLDRYGATRKVMARAYAYSMLLQNLVADNFRMTEDTWRGNSWNETAAKMRFDENAWVPTKEQFVFSFDKLMELLDDFVAKKNGFDPIVLKHTKIELEERLFDIVRKNMGEANYLYV